MKYQQLGRSSLRVSSLAYGMWRFGGTSLPIAQKKVETALSLGITLFDQADVYVVDGGGAFGDSETLLGAVLKASPHLRDQMIIATKGGIVLGTPYDSSTHYIRSAVEASLRRMNIDCIDLYQIHRPDVLTHPQELATVLTSLRIEGKIKEVGVSNYSPSQFEALQAHLSFPIATHQPQFSCWHLDPLQNGLFDQCQQYNVTPLAWSPMAGGHLGLSIDDARHKGDVRLVQLLSTLDRIAEDQHLSRGAVALAWLLYHPSQIIPILGTQNLERLVESVHAFSVRLDRQTWYEILVASQGFPLP